MSKQPGKRIPPKPVDTIFSLPKSALISIVEDATRSGPIVNLEIKIEHEKQGHKGGQSESVIATFYYQTQASITRDIVMFVKRQHSPDDRETDNYLAFAQAGIPTPKYYGRLVGSNGEEILFLEFLPDIGIDAQNELEVREWVGLLARISATKLPLAHFTIPEVNPADEQQPPDLSWWEPVLKRIWEAGPTGELGLEVCALCRENPHGVSILSDYGARVEKRVGQMETGLHQSDAAVQNVGWRITETGKEIVVFDLVGFGVGPRFYDISNVMGTLSESVLSREDIVAHFCAEYTKWSGERITLEEFLDDVAWVSDIVCFWCLPWYLNMSQSGESFDWTDDIEEGRKTFRSWLHGGLKQILASANEGKPLHAKG